MAQHKFTASLDTILEESPYTFWTFDLDGCDGCNGADIDIGKMSLSTEYQYTPKMKPQPKPISVYIDNHSVEDLFNMRTRIIKKTNLSSSKKYLSLRRFVLQRNTHLSFEKYIFNNYHEIIECDDQISYFVRKHE